MINQNRNILLRVNSISSIAYQVVSLCCGFILPKLIISNFGSATNGLLSSITQFLGVIALCELGMGAVVPASLYKPLAEKDNDQISKIVISSERFYRKIAIGMLIYVTVLTIIYPFIIDGYSFLYTSTLILILASSTFAQYYFGVTYSLLLAADQKQYLSYGLNAAVIVINLLLTYVLITIGCSIHVVKFASAVVFIARPIFYSSYVSHHYQIDKQINYNVEPIKQKWNGVAQHIAYTVQEKSGFLILSVMATLVEVSIYSIYYMILEGLRGFVYSVTSSLTSYLGNIIAKDEHSLLKSSFQVMEWSIHTIAVLLFTCAGVLIVPFISVYTKGITDADYIVPVFPAIICAAIGCRCLQMPYNIVIQAAGHFKETQNSAILEPVINIFVSITLVHFIGLTGVAIGMLVSMLYRMAYLALYLTKHILNSSVRLFCKRLIADILLIVAIVASTSFINLNEVTYLSWTFMAIKVVAIALVATLAINAILYPKLSVNMSKRLIGRVYNIH